jgi:hypothetical protein
MNKEYFIEKLKELKTTHEYKLKNIDEILTKCNVYENEIQEKIIFFTKENQDLLNLLKDVDNIFDAIIRELI